MVTWNDDAREAFIAGSAGAKSYPGTGDVKKAFTAGQIERGKRPLQRKKYPIPKDKPQWQQNLDREIKKFGSNVGTMLSDAPKFPKKGMDYLFEQMPSIPKYVGMLAKGLTRHGEEVDEAERDYEIPWWKGGNPIAVDQGSYADQFLEPLMTDKRAYNQAVGKDKVFWGGLEEMSGDTYDASHPGLIALLNDPSRLKDMDPIRGLNYMRSITGEPSNVGFDQFEAMRAGDFEGLNLPGEAASMDYGGLDATEIAKKLLPQYRAAAADMYGEGFLGNTAAATYGDTSEVPAHIKQATGVAPNAYYGDRDVLLDMNIPYQDKYLEQFDIAEGLSPMEKYLLQSKAQGRGGFEEDSEQAMIDAGFDMDYIGRLTQMKIGKYPSPIEEEEEEQGTPFYQ